MIFSSHKIRNVFILLVVLVLSGCDKIEKMSQYYEAVLKPYEKKPNVNVRFSHTDPTEKYYKGSVVWIDYPLGKLKIPADYYQSGSISPDYAVADMYVFWPAMVGYLAGSKGQFDINSIRLFTTFEKEKGTRFTHEDYYLTLQERIKNDRVAYVRASPQYPGLTEYWSTALPKTREQMKKSQHWHIYYLTDDPQITSPEGHPLTMRCRFFGVAPDILVQPAKKKSCRMQWHIDESMAIEIDFNPIVLDDWQTMHHGLSAFINNIRME